MNKSYEWYRALNKPRIAPPPWIFGPVWTILYIGIAVSFGYVGYLYFNGEIPFLILLPFLFNLVVNAIFTPIQFGLRNLTLATIDILLVLLSLIVALTFIFPFAAWVVYMNIPYLLWVSFASALQIAITSMNRK
jgi:tryptophan-rich sensory protein